MNNQQIARELTAVARDLVSDGNVGSDRLRKAGVDYLDALGGMQKAFKVFSRQYMNALGGMYENRGENPELDSRASKNERDEIADGFVVLGQAINDHFRSVSRIR